MTPQKEFAEQAVEILRNDTSVIGLAVGGSWLSNEIDEFSDLDLVIVTVEKITGNRSKMVGLARSLGNFLSGFTGEHVGEPRLLICLYDNPLLHVDIKFLTLDEFRERIEMPVILLDTNGQLEMVLTETKPDFPYPDYQWLEDRFWIWTHYALLKIGRGEYLEAVDFFGFLRMVVFGPLLHIKNNSLPRGVRKVEMVLKAEEMHDLISTIPAYSKESLLSSLHTSIALYRQLRSVLFTADVLLQNETENKVIDYLSEIENNQNADE